MNIIKIPTRFEIGGRTIKIKHSERLIDEQCANGQVSYRNNEITIHKNTNGAKRPIDTHVETYLHEITHLILNMMEEHELRDSEKFVSVFSQYLHQILKTSKYE